MNLYKLLSVLVLVTGINSSCKKSSFLAPKPDESLVVPSTLQDFQAVLDNTAMMNGGINAFAGLDPSYGIAACDDIFLLQSRYNSLSSEAQNLYRWNDEIYGARPDGFYAWDISYRAVFYSNIVLDGIKKIPVTDENKDIINNLKGSALFYRARMFYQLLEIFSLPYDKNISAQSPGIALKSTSDINEVITRSSMEDSYQRVITDLKTSIDLLPDMPLYKTRPSKVSAYAMLAKVYLAMHDYENALQYSERSLQLYSGLMDYNQLTPTISRPFGTKVEDNSEIIFHAIAQTSNFAAILSHIDTTFFSLYEADDIRRDCFFRTSSGYKTVKVGYDPSGAYFTGIATDEVLLIRAECYARKGDTAAAMYDLNTLRRNRIKTISYQPLAALDQNDALQKVLLERRKELVMRGLRWTDLRRLNQEGANITLTRKINNEIISLPPNDPKYTYLIPPSVIGFSPDMPQNGR